jgi:exonuclease SbcC
VLVNEAVNLGIAIYNMRQGEGIRYETLFRDETVGALDAANAKEYVRMLRRAMDLGGFHQVIFICHTPLVWELADRVLSVGGGDVVAGGRGAATTENHPGGIAFEPAVLASSITSSVPSGRQASE